MSSQVVELVKEYGLSLPITEPKILNRHERRVCDLTNRPEPWLLSAGGLLVRSIRREFPLEATRTLVEKFPYAAHVWDIRAHDAVTSGNKLIQYIGDIPEAALDRIEKFQDMVKDQYNAAITIHSLTPLPIRELAFIDPLLIGWIGNPEIKLKHNILWQPRCKADNIVARGSVLAVWNNAQELEL